MRIQAEKVINIALIDLKPYENNARTHSGDQIEKIANSIQEFGFINPVIIDENNTILVGHGRVMAAEQAGMTQAPCIRVTDLTDDQKRAYILADNKLSDMAGWDIDLLTAEIENIDIDMALFGFDIAEIDTPDLDELEQEAETDDKFIIKITFDTYNEWLEQENEFRQLVERSNAIMVVGTV